MTPRDALTTMLAVMTDTAPLARFMSGHDNFAAAFQKDNVRARLFGVSSQLSHAKIHLPSGVACPPSG